MRAITSHHQTFLATRQTGKVFDAVYINIQQLKTTAGLVELFNVDIYLSGVIYIVIVAWTSSVEVLAKGVHDIWLLSYDRLGAIGSMKPFYFRSYPATESTTYISRRLLLWLCARYKDQGLSM